MLKNYKLKVIISFAIILLPILLGVLLWNDLDNMTTTHWGFDENVSGFYGKGFAVFGLPLIFLFTHFICLRFTLCDKQQKNQNPKALGMVFWMIPFLSLFANGIMYRAAFGGEFHFALLVPVLLGIMFVFIGNYLPKIKQNRTLGIKVVWALHNEENWNLTHRLGGKVWVVGGLILVFAVFLPLAAMAWVMFGVIFAMVVIPAVYSYIIFRRHQREGIVYAAPAKSKAEKIANKRSAFFVPVILAGVGILMFTGNIEVRCEDTSFTIHATYWTDFRMEYSAFDTISYRKGLDVGMRTNGFGSARLLNGIFQNDEFGSYTLYAYTGAKEFVVLTSGTKTLVIGMKDANDTQAIYDAMVEKIGV